MKINVVPDKLQYNSAEIMLVNDELCREMEQIESLVLSLNGDWQGEAEKVFAGRILYVKNQFSHISNFFEQYANLLNDFAVKYEENDNDIASKIQLV